MKRMARKQRSLRISEEQWEQICVELVHACSICWKNPVQALALLFWIPKILKILLFFFPLLVSTLLLLLVIFSLGPQWEKSRLDWLLQGVRFDPPCDFSLEGLEEDENFQIGFEERRKKQVGKMPFNSDFHSMSRASLANLAEKFLGSLVKELGGEVELDFITAVLEDIAQVLLIRHAEKEVYVSVDESVTEMNQPLYIAEKDSESVSSLLVIDSTDYGDTGFLLGSQESCNVDGIQRNEEANSPSTTLLSDNSVEVQDFSFKDKECVSSDSKTLLSPTVSVTSSSSDFSPQDTYIVDQEEEGLIFSPKKEEPPVPIRTDIDEVSSELQKKVPKAEDEIGTEGRNLEDSGPGSINSEASAEILKKESFHNHSLRVSEDSRKQGKLYALFSQEDEELILKSEAFDSFNEFGESQSVPDCPAPNQCLKNQKGDEVSQRTSKPHAIGKHFALGVPGKAGGGTEFNVESKQFKTESLQTDFGPFGLRNCKSFSSENLKDEYGFGTGYCDSFSGRQDQRLQGRPMITGRLKSFPSESLTFVKKPQFLSPIMLLETEEMDHLWEKYHDASTQDVQTASRDSTTSDLDSVMSEFNDSEAEVSRLCCLDAFKFPARKMHWKRPSMKKISKAIKKFGIMQHFKHNKPS